MLVFDSSCPGGIGREDLILPKALLAKHTWRGASHLRNINTWWVLGQRRGQLRAPGDHRCLSDTDGFSSSAFPSVAFIIYLQLLWMFTVFLFLKWLFK